ncbi:MAG: hypothetical protein ACI4VF_02000 [Lachnospirales bacterium]
MSNWFIKCLDKYFTPLVERMKQELLKLPVTLSGEVPTQVIKESTYTNSNVIYGYTAQEGFIKIDKYLFMNIQRVEIITFPWGFTRSVKAFL